MNGREEKGKREGEGRKGKGRGGEGYEGREGKEREGSERKEREWRHLVNYNIPEDATDYRTMFSIINRNQQSQTNSVEQYSKLNFICYN